MSLYEGKHVVSGASNNRGSAAATKHAVRTRAENRNQGAGIANRTGRDGFSAGGAGLIDTRNA